MVGAGLARSLFGNNGGGYSFGMSLNDSNQEEETDKLHTDMQAIAHTLLWYPQGSSVS